MNRISEDLATAIFIFASYKCCDPLAQLGQRTLLPTRRCLCCSTEYDCVSFSQMNYGKILPVLWQGRKQKFFHAWGWRGSQNRGYVLSMWLLRWYGFLGKSVHRETQTLPAWRESLSSSARAITISDCSLTWTQWGLLNSGEVLPAKPLVLQSVLGCPGMHGPSLNCKKMTWCGRRSPWLNGEHLTEFSEQNKH